MFPAIVIWILISISAGNDYFWKVYFMVGGVYLAASLVLGFFVPCVAPKHWKQHPGLWLFSQGLLAWMVATLALTVLNLTPLCVGQDNGDGSNDVVLCMLQTGLVSIVYSPLGFILLCLTALPGGWFIRQLIKGTEA